VIPAIMAALRAGSATSALGGAEGLLGSLGKLGGAHGPGKEMFFDAASQSIKNRATPPSLPNQASKAAGALKPLTELSGSLDVLKGGAQDLIKPLGALGHPFQKLEENAQKLYGAVNFLPSKFLEAKQMITSTADNFVATLAGPIDTVKQLGDSVSRFVSKANPAKVKQFEMAVGDAQATIGNLLLPVLEALTRTAREAGDTYAKLKPALKPVFSEVANTIDLFSKEMGPAAKEMAPWLKMAASQMRIFNAGLKLQIPLWNGLMKVMNGPLAMLGMGGFNPNEKADKEVRSVSTTTNAESISQKAMEQALMMALNGEKQQDPKEKALFSIEGLLGKIKEKLDAYLPGFPTQKDIEKFIADLLRSSPGQVLDSSAGRTAQSLSPALALVGMLRSAMTR
jgi:hypothetical protein